MIVRTIKTILFLICVIGLLLIPLSNIFLYKNSGISISDDIMREFSERAEHTNFQSSDISTFVNDYYIFYIPPAINRQLEYIDAFDDNYGQYNYANLSTIQLFSYENGATINVEWLNGTAINGTYFENDRWIITNRANIKWLEDIKGQKTLKKKYELDEYETEEIQISSWMVTNKNTVKKWDNYRLMSGVVKITSDYPISVMHHKNYPTGAVDDNGYSLVNDNWDGIFSAIGKKLFTRITGDCWISALEAATTVHVWDYSDKNDDIELHLDRFEGWAYSRNAIFEQYGFDDDLVLISADKPISLVAGLQSDQSFVQVFGQDGRDFHFPCFGKIIIHAPEGANKIIVEDPNGNQGSYDDLSLGKDEMKIIDFKVAYKQQRYSSFEWATIRSSDPVYVYTYVNSIWYLNEDIYGLISGEEYINTYKKTNQLYSLGWVPYPANNEFKIPLRSRAFVTVVNLEKSNNKVEIDLEKLKLPYKTKLGKYESVTLDYSKECYYFMDLVNRDTHHEEPSSWLTRDPDNRYILDYIPRISLNTRNSDNSIDIDSLETVDKVSWQNITKGSFVKIKSDHPVLVFINYDNPTRYGYQRYNDDSNNYQSAVPQGIDLIPGLTPPAIRGPPDFTATIVFFSGIIIAVDMIIVSLGRKSMVELL